MVSQYEVWLVALDPTIGHEIKKTRPAVVISPDEMNEKIATVLIAPMTTKSHPYPSRVALRFAQKDGWVVLDKIRCIDKARLAGRLGKLKRSDIQRVKAVIREMLVD